MFISLRTFFSRLLAPLSGPWAREERCDDVTHLLEPELRPLPVAVAGTSWPRDLEHRQGELVPEHDFSEEVTEYLSPQQARRLPQRSAAEAEDTVPVHRVSGVVARSGAHRG